MFHTSTGAHAASHSVGNRSYFTGVKAAELWGWPLTSLQYRGYNEWRYTFPPRRHLRGAFGTGLTFSCGTAAIHEDCGQRYFFIYVQVKASGVTACGTPKPSSNKQDCEVAQQQFWRSNTSVILNVAVCLECDTAWHLAVSELCRAMADTWTRGRCV